MFSPHAGRPPKPVSSTFWSFARTNKCDYVAKFDQFLRDSNEGKFGSAVISMNSWQCDENSHPISFYVTRFAVSGDSL
jgi:hypothetical protein